MRSWASARACSRIQLSSIGHLGLACGPGDAADQAVGDLGAAFRPGLLRTGVAMRPEAMACNRSVSSRSASARAISRMLRLIWWRWFP